MIGPGFHQLTDNKAQVLKTAHFLVIFDFSATYVSSQSASTKWDPLLPTLGFLLKIIPFEHLQNPLISQQCYEISLAFLKRDGNETTTCIVIWIRVIIAVFCESMTEKYGNHHHGCCPCALAEPLILNHNESIIIQKTLRLAILKSMCSIMFVGFNKEEECCIWAEMRVVTMESPDGPWLFPPSLCHSG